MEITALRWTFFLVFIVITLGLDLGVFHKKDTEVKVREAILWSGFWILLALLFNAGIYFTEEKPRPSNFSQRISWKNR